MTISISEQQSCEIKETNGFLQAMCMDKFGFVVHQCPYSNERYWILEKLDFMTSLIFNATCSNDPFGYQVLI